MHTLIRPNLRHRSPTSGPKALYSTDCEDDRVTIVQSLVLIGWSREGPGGTLNATSRL